MPGGFALAEAFVRIRPDATGFRPEADAKLKAAMTGLNVTVRVKADTAAAKITVADLRVLLEALSKRIYEAKFRVNTAGAQAQLAGMTLAAHQLDKELNTTRNSLGQFTKALTLEQALRAQQRMFGLVQQLNNLEGGLKAANKDGNVFTRMINAWGPSLQRGGRGLFFTVAGLHLLIDGIIEVAAVLIPAGLALTAFGLAGANTVNTIADHLHNLQNVFTATGKALPPLTTQFSRLQNAIQPSVLQLYGQGLLALRTTFGTFGRLANLAAGIVDHFGARLVYDIQHGTGAISALLAHAGPDLTELAQLFGNLGGIIGHVLRALPGFAEFFLKVAVALSKLLLVISDLPTPILTLILALHGVYLWGGLFNQILIRMLTGISNVFPAVGIFAGRLGLIAKTSPAASAGLKTIVDDMGFVTVGAASTASKTGRLAGVLTRLGAFASSPWTWAVLGVAALGALIVWENKQKDAADRMISSLAAVNSAGNVGALAVIGKNIATLNQGLKETGVTTTQTLVAWRNFHGQLTQNEVDFNKLTGATQKQVDAGRNLLQGAALIEHTYHVTYPEALAFATLAHVDLTKGITGTSKEAETAQIQIQALLLGYKNMGVTGSQTASDVLAMQFALKQQDSTIVQLNSAWDTYITTLSSSQDALLGFEQQLQGFAAAAQGASVHVSSGRASLSSSLTAASNAAKSTGASMKGTNAASIQLQETWQQLFHSGQSVVDALRLQGVEGNKLTGVVAGVAKQELLLAGNNKTAREEIVGFINQAVGPGTVTLQNLNHWVKQNGISLSALRKIVENSTGALTDLQKAASTLSSTLNQQVASVFSAAALKASGATEAIQAYTASLIKNGAQSQTTHDDWTTAITTLEKLGYTQKQATDLLAGYTKGLHRNADVASGARQARLQLQKDTAAAGAGYRQTTKDLLNYTKQVVDHGVKSDQARAARKRLIADIMSSGTNAKTATDKFAGLIAKILGIPKKRVLEILEHGLGDFKIKDMGIFSKTAPGNSGTNPLLHPRPKAGPLFGAQGLFINRGTTPTADDVMVRASKGELIVPTHMVNAGAVDHLRGSIPGFAGGGLVQQENMAGVLSGQAIVNFDKRFVSRLTSAMESRMSAALKSAQAQAQQAYYASQVAGYGGGVGRWAGLVRRVLGMEGLPFSDAPTILSQIGSESSGNPNIVNTWDSNAARGTPSMGLLQVIGPTFARYHWPGTSWNILDPLANVAAGVNYAVHTYGNPGFLSVLGHGHGYDTGGWLPPGLSLAYNGTGKHEKVVAPMGSSRHQGGNVHIHGNLVVREKADAYLIARSLAFQLDQ